jgi:putative phosphoribosyl transferase
MTRFANRKEAGEILADHLAHLSGAPNLLVLALPRGGVPVAYEVALRFQAPLDIFLVRKIGLPGHEEYAIGALASGGVYFLNQEVVQRLELTSEAIEQVIARETDELERRARVYGAGLSPEVEGRTVILVDDGLATGSTMKVAVRAVRDRGPARIVVAIPVGSDGACLDLEHEADEVVCPRVPDFFQAVGQWYEDFSQTSDEEVRELLDQARRWAPVHHGAG